MKRLFVATKIELDESFTDLTKRLKEHCRFDKIVWVNQEINHLTLRFLGKTPDNEIPELNNILHTIAENTSAFSLQIDKLGVFGSKYAPSVIWLGFKEFTPYRQLFEKLETELLQHDFEPAYGNFVPHITLGRIKSIDNKKKFWQSIEQNQVDFSQTIKIDHISLYQSKLHNDGPEYRELEKVFLK